MLIRLISVRFQTPGCHVSGRFAQIHTKSLRKSCVLGAFVFEYPHTLFIYIVPLRMRRYKNIRTRRQEHGKNHHKWGA